MKTFQMVAAEFRRLTATPMAVIALVALTCVPILYGGLYLWANQDPYAQLDQVPVALVVEDTGATVSGQERNYGDDIADQLVKDGTFDWHRVSAADAAAGVRNSTFDFTVTLPADFSDALASAQGANPRQAEVLLTTNDANSYLASTIGEQAVKTIRTSIVEQVNREAATQFLTGLATIRGQLTEAASGATQLTDGSTTAASGAHTLVNGTTQLAAGAAQIAAGNAELAARADTVAGLASDAVSKLPQARQDIVDALVASGTDQATIDQVLSRLDEVGTVIQDGNQRLQAVVGQVDELAAGSQTLANGLNDAVAGSASLATGLDTLSSGLGTLTSGLNSGVDAIPDYSAEVRAAQAETIANPVELKNTAVTSAGTYGAGLAPFFASLAAWIGIYALFLIVKPFSRRAITALRAPLRVTLAAWLTPGALGAVQMAGLFAVLAIVLGFSMTAPLGVFGIMLLSSLTFAAIILALNVWLGSVGQFVGLVLMVLQLVTAGGTFPWQTLPAPLAALHHVLPMSYSVDAMRQFMYGGDMAMAGRDAWVLGAWLLVALGIAAVGIVRMTRSRTLHDLRPSLIG